MPDTPQTELILIRHGETAWNLERRLQGHLDSDLTPLGVRQAKAIARRLAVRKPDVLYSSDLGRALQTAEIISREIGVPAQTDSRLRERNLGVLQGKTREEQERDHPEALAQLLKDPNTRVLGGETSVEVDERTAACIQEITQRHLGKRIAIVSHGGVINRMFLRVMGIPLDRAHPRTFRLPNAGINRFSFDGEKWMLESWGETSHLDDLGALDDD